ncbi:Calcium-transporting ATPase [Methanocorpusculaceae archaeon Sp1]|nr:Calcium-transporting ATPase [Methanocorpusculaceae archaeon Sp1]
MDKLDFSSGQSWYSLSVSDTESRLATSLEQGLSFPEAEERRKTFGGNVLQSEKKPSFIRVFLRQYRDYMQIILLAAAALSLYVGNVSTALLLFALTLLNAILGIRSERQAADSVAALKKMMKTTTRCLRDGALITLAIEELVPGDVVEFESGDIVPADGRIVYSAALEIEESALTGESQPVPKEIAVLSSGDMPIGDQANMGFMNTVVTRGKGKMIVTGTGMNTEVGKIAGMLREVKEEKTPLTKKIDQLSIAVAIIAAIALILLISIGLYHGESFDDLFTLGIALAVAAVPTGLPVVMTLMLSVGTMDLAKRGAIVKRLPSVETLGSTSAICSDKTGTLTMNQMTAREIVVAGRTLTVTGEGYYPNGQIQHVGGAPIASLDPIFLPMVLCSDATVSDGKLVGDPTEGALVILAEKGGLNTAATRAEYPRLAEVPFDSEYKFMATFHAMTDPNTGKEIVRCYVKGAPDVLVSRGVSYIDTNTTVSPLAGSESAILAANDDLAKKGLRVMMIAYRDFDPATFDSSSVTPESIRDLTIVAMVGIIDPPRPEVKDAIATCKTAGIRVRMITGDHGTTAGAIADQLGISGKVITGAEMSAMSDEQLRSSIDDIGVVARVAPEHKVRLVQTLKEKGDIVAMTGDGVNDAPALKAADIGVAMGITGTEVSKESAEMILTDDNFATIVTAVRQGRVLYDNMLKFIRFQMANLMAYILLFLFAALFVGAYTGIFAPVQTLFISYFVTVPVGMALCYDTAAPGIMTKKPRPKDERIMSGWFTVRMILVGIYWGAAPLAGYIWIESTGGTPEQAIAMTMITFILLHIPFTANLRFPDASIFTREFLTNRTLFIMFLVVIAWAVILTEIGFMQSLFGTAALGEQAWFVAIMIAVVALFLGEAGKAIARRVLKRSPAGAAVPA